MLPNETRPIIEMNTTPLIDVMLVLLIMLIITIPIQTHAVKLDLPKVCTTCPAPNPVKNEIVITRADAILWNGTAVTESELRYLLAATQRMKPTPELHLRPDPESRYETVDRVLGSIKRGQVRKVGFVGNEAYAVR
ncbi:MAG: ExbD/TolR family protein [Sphingomicrobium sp.]